MTPLQQCASWLVGSDKKETEREINTNEGFCWYLSHLQLPWTMTREDLTKTKLQSLWTASSVQEQYTSANCIILDRKVQHLYTYIWKDSKLPDHGEPIDHSTLVGRKWYVSTIYYDGMDLTISAYIQPLSDFITTRWTPLKHYRATIQLTMMAFCWDVKCLRWLQTKMDRLMMILKSCF